MTRTRRQLLIRSAVAWLAVAVIVFPFAWVVLSLLKNPDGFLSLDLADALPRSIDLTSYTRALERADLLRWLATSFFVASATAVLSISLAAPMAYDLTRLRFRGRRPASGLLILHYAIPSVTIAVPLFVLLVALVDGAGLWQVLRRVVLPLSLPGLLAAGAYAFILSWNDFLFAFILIASGDNFTAPVGIHAFFTGRNIEQSTWAQLMAASTLVSLPSVILFAIFQRYLVSGMLSGSVRG